ncbi:MAG: hypothetical protein LBP61_06065, partial [Desulfovibrio sp.]|nr:hypothetical protein [Desulfovibrio sp.]
LLTAAVRHERAARIWGVWTGIFLLLVLTACLHWESFFSLLPSEPGIASPLPPASDENAPTLFRQGAALGAGILGYAVLLAAMAGCWRMFLTERRLGTRNRQKATHLAAARALAAAAPGLRETFLQNAVQALCRNAGQGRRPHARKNADPG